MVTCKKCNVNINTAVKKCPLCQNEIEADDNFGNFDSNVFPYVESTHSHFIWQKILAALFFAIVGICTFIDCLINKQITWSIFPDLGVICVGASIAIGLELKRSLSNILFYEYIFVCLITYFWDRITGMHNWDLNYVLPILSVVFIVANYVLRLVFRREFIKYIRNVAFASVVGILCMFFYIKGYSTSIIPSFMSSIVGGIALILIITFDGKKTFTELKMRLHI